MRRRTWLGIAAGSIAAPLGGYSAWQRRDEWFEKRTAVVVPGQVVRGAWQCPRPLRRIVAREGVRTILTLTAINADDPKYVEQERVVRELGLAWRFVPIRGSYANLDEMAQAVEILADPALRPIFYHCVAGHHRSSQVQAAYRIARQGWSAARAWAEVAALPWARPATDREDRRLIEAFASHRKDHADALAHAPSTAQGPAPVGARRDGEPRRGPGLDAPDLVELRRG